MFDVTFAEDTATTVRGKPCYMCKAKEYAPVLTVKPGHYVKTDLTAGKCLNCGTVNFLEEDPVLGYDYTGFDEEYWYNYVQNGAGITAMLEPLLAIDRPRKASLLDIGCGFGFVPHFWSELGYGEAVGLETSIYGKVGKEKLGLNIIHSYYNDAEEIKGKKFDYVFSSEVIEHVDDPAAFLEEIGQALADDGILALTTPSSGAVTKDTDFTTLIATLSPGFHYFIASKDALETLLKAAGYAHVLVRDTGHRLFAWASHKPLPEIAEAFSDWAIYLEYLNKLSTHTDPHIASGAQYRLLKDSVNLGELEWAKRIYPKFAALSKDHFNLDYTNIAASADWRAARTELDNKTYPSWMGCGMLFAGLYMRRCNTGDLQTQHDLFEAAADTMEIEIDLFAQFAGEPAYFIHMARQELAEAKALLANGHTKRPEHGQKTSPKWKFWKK